MKNPVIVSALRSPIGGMGGVFKDYSAVELGVDVLKQSLKNIKLSPESIDEIILGNVLGAGLGQNVARQIAMGSGIPEGVPSYTVNKVCGSGMKSITLAASMVRLEEGEVFIAGGVENMSRVPFALEKYRWGGRMGNQEITDLMVHDGLWDIFNDYHMGVTAENLAERFEISREKMDEFAAKSQNKTEEAMKSNRFKEEIVPIHIPGRKGKITVVEKDEFPRSGVTVESLSKLKPCFKKDGKVTAATSSGINDGSAVLVIMSEDKAAELKMIPLVRIKAYASAGVAPSIMGIGPVPAIEKALKRSGWSWKDLDLIELNEAFAAQSLAVIKELKRIYGDVDEELINVNGGAIALGHPIGCSGARITVTLIHEMIKRGSARGLAALCIGGGMGIALTLERI